MCVSFDPTILYIGMFAKEIIGGFGKKVCTRVFIMVLFYDVETCL